jgi:hypothetical protein
MPADFDGGDSPFDFDHRYQGPAYTDDHHAWRATLRAFVDQCRNGFTSSFSSASSLLRELRIICQS